MTVTVNQSVLMIVADIDPSGLDALRRTLSRMGQDPADNDVFPLARLDTLHFASLVLAEGPGLDPPELLFENNVDGTVDEWLDRLVADGAAGLDSLFAASPDYPSRGDPNRLRTWLEDHVVPPGAFHIGATGRTLARIAQEAQLHDAIEAFVDDEEASGGLAGASPEAVRARIQDFVRADPALAWAEGKAPERQTARQRRGHRARLGGTVGAAVVLSPVLVPVLFVAVAVLLVKERMDPVQRGAPDPDHVAKLQADEDYIAQNHLSSVIAVKPGMLRAVALPGVLHVLNLVARASATKGKLGGIPSIHFAHWSLINDGRHLVFLSNFDGSWESYLGDFIDKAATGLTAVWSNTVDFPRTFLLAFKGAADGPRFRHWARAHQCPTAVWYSAYPKKTMPIIDNNSSIREGLFADPKEGIAAWLKRL